MFVITGAAGRVGNVLLRALRAAEPDRPLRALLLPGESTRSIDGLGVEVVRGDVRDVASLAAAFDGADGVFHVAGYISLAGDDARLRAINVDGPANVVAACRSTGVRRLVHVASTHAIAEPAEATTILDESVPLDPSCALGAYGKSKAAGAQVVLQAAREDLDAVVVCPSGILGPFDWLPSAQGRYLVDAVRRGFVAHVGGGYDFVDVRDLAAGIAAAMHKGRRGEHYILSGEYLSLRDMGELAGQAVGRHVRQIQLPVGLARAAAVVTPLWYRLSGTTPNLTAESLDIVFGAAKLVNAKARHELGFSTRPLSETVRDQMYWFAAEGYLPPALARTAVAGAAA